MGKRVIKAILKEKEFSITIINVRGVDERVYLAFKEMCRDNGETVGAAFNRIVGKLVEEYASSPDKE